MASLIGTLTFHEEGVINSQTYKTIAMTFYGNGNFPACCQGHVAAVGGMAQCEPWWLQSEATEFSRSLLIAVLL